MDEASLLVPSLNLFYRMITRHLSIVLVVLAAVHVNQPIRAERPESNTTEQTSLTSVRRASKPELHVSDFEDLQALARQTAATAYVPEPPLIPVLAQMNYEQYREIQFRHDQGVWNDSRHPFWLEFFHRGFVQQDRVDVYQVNHDSRSGAAKQIQYYPDQFHFGGAAADLNVPPSVGYAGIKIAGRFEPEGDPQELLTFLGSSYFRSRTADTVYGTSARGLAVNIGMNQDEEFPDFRSFWVQEPSPSDRTVRVLALLDSPTLAGAYEFAFDPGATVSQMDVRATLYFREAPDKLAIAPLTSMWIWGDGLQGPPLDERPSVHDCDGLLIHEGDDWTWRGLARLPYPSVTSTAVRDVQGFGLLQRDRDFEHYRDSNARYHERPSVWVRPNDSWGQGRIELLEIPGAHEGIDNIGAYFVSDTPVDGNHPMELNYTVFFFSNEAALRSAVIPIDESGSQLLTCRAFDVKRNDERIMLELEFGQPDPDDGDSIASVDDFTEAVDAHGMTDHTPGFVDAAAQLIRGKLIDQSVERTATGYSVMIEMEATEDAAIEIELTLKDDEGNRMSETFRYLCPHETPTFTYPAVYTRQE